MSQMCPDRQLLSVYFDGELPSPWKEKMESHVANCLSCREELETYRDLSIGLVPEKETIKAAQDRIWQKMEKRLNPAMAGENRIWWRRRISIPIPAAAAAALLLIALALVWVTRNPVHTQTPGMSFISDNDFDTPGIIPLSDMADVLHYLSAGDTNELLIIRLPESRNFVSHGEPAIIRAADYSRQTANQRRRP